MITIPIPTKGGGCITNAMLSAPLHACLQDPSSNNTPLVLRRALRRQAGYMPIAATIVFGASFQEPKNPGMKLPFLV
eukprot:572270-Amphidinium_carterae.1